MEPSRPATAMPKLYHFTCSHAKPLIERSGRLIPQVTWRRLDTMLVQHGEAMTGLWRAPAVVWLTDMAIPERETLGLTSRTLSCDRTEWRCTVDAAAAVPWIDFATRWDANPEYLATLSGDPARWFVAFTPVPVLSIHDRRSCLTPTGNA